MLLVLRNIDLLHLATDKHTMNYEFIVFYIMYTEDLLRTSLCNLMVLTLFCFIHLLYIKAMFIQCTLTFESFLSCGHRQRRACEKTALCMTGLEMRDKVKERETERDQST